MKKREVRAILKANLRAKADAAKPTIEGYAAVFNVEAEIYSYAGYSFRETIKSGAFARSLQENADVRCLFNHDADAVLGRTKSKTLELKEDDKGLFFSCELPDTQQARDVHALIQRGDIDECSFGFYVVEQEWKEKEDGDLTIQTRTLLDVDLFDVSPVTFPAYPETSVSARALWPDGMPTELRKRFEKRDDKCACDCPECQDGDCIDCSDPDCNDPNCAGDRCMEKSRSKNHPLTKSVDGEQLGPDQFAFVGDATDVRTWKLPISTKAIRNSISRFNELKAIPETAKPAAWEKLVKSACSLSVDVSEEDRGKWNLTDEQFGAFRKENADKSAEDDEAATDRIRQKQLEATK